MDPIVLIAKYTHMGLYLGSNFASYLVCLFTVLNHFFLLEIAVNTFSSNQKLEKTDKYTDYLLKIPTQERNEYSNMTAM